MPFSASPEAMNGTQKQQHTNDQSNQLQQQKRQIVRRQISQSKMPETMKKRETETVLRKAPPSADVRCGTRRLFQSEKVPLLNKTFTAANTSVATDFRQRCRDGTLRSPTPIFRRLCHRSNSIDSDLSDIGPDVIFGVLNQPNRTKSRERSKWNFNWKMPKSSNCNSTKNGTCNSNSKFSCGAASSMEMSSSTKLPQLNGFCPGRTSCQLQHVSRSHFELIKYKRTLNS